MTTSTLNTAAFDVYSVPPAGTTRNRFPYGRTPGGHVAPPDEAYANIAHNATLDRLREAPEITPDRKTVELFKIVRDDATGKHSLVTRPAVRAVPTRDHVRPGKFAKLEAQGVELLNDALVGGESYLAATDRQLWEAALAAAEDVDAKGRPLRVLSDAVACLILCRAGIVLAPHDLPWE